MELSRPGAENVIAELPAQGSTRLEDYIDTTILDELKAEGFFTALRQKYAIR